MKNLIVLSVFAVLVAVALASKCCPQPDSDEAGKCGCCPDACCCICETMSVNVTLPPAGPTTTISQTTSETCVLGGLDVIFIVDNSASIGQDNWVLVQEALRFIVSSPAWMNVGVDTRFGFVDFELVANRRWGINDTETDSVANLLTAIDAVPYIGDITGTPAGLNIASDEFEFNDRDDALYPDVAILLADGKTNNPLNPAVRIAAADRLKSLTELVYAVGVGEDVALDELEGISDGDGDENISLVDDFDALLALIQTIVDSLERSICTIVEAARTTPAPPTTAPPPMLAEVCKCCCPPLPDPCDKVGSDTCCCRFDQDNRRRR